MQQDQVVDKEPKVLRVRQGLRELKEPLVHKVHKEVMVHRVQQDQVVDKEPKVLRVRQVYKEFRVLKEAKDHKELLAL